MSHDHVLVTSQPESILPINQKPIRNKAVFAQLAERGTWLEASYTFNGLRVNISATSFCSIFV